MHLVLHTVNKTRVLVRRVPDGKLQKRLRFRVLCDLVASLGARACVQVLCVQKRGVVAFALLGH